MKKIFHLQENTFDIAHVSHYTLYILLSDQYLQISCINQQQCLLISGYTLRRTHFLDDLCTLYNQSVILQQKNWTAITIAYNNPLFTILPEKFFAVENIFEDLQINCPVYRHTHQAHYYIHTKEKICVSFAVMKNIHAFFFQEYSTKLRQKHVVNIGISHALFYQKKKYETNIHMLFGIDYLMITVLQKGTLIFCNRFSCGYLEKKSLYYLQCVIKILNLKNFGIYCSGFITSKSYDYVQAQKYGYTISIQQHTHPLQLSGVFKKNQMDRCTDLLHMDL